MNRNGFRLLMYYLFLLVAPTLVIADSSDETGSDISTDISTNSSTKNGSRSAESDTVTDSIPGDSNNDKPEKVDNVATDKTDQSLTGSDSLLDDEDKNTTVLKVVVIQIGEEKLPIKDARVIITYGDATEFERKTDSSGMAMMTGLPYGKVDVDVTSSGRQSDGGTLLLDEPNKTLTFYLKPRTVSD